MYTKAQRPQRQNLHARPVSTNTRSAALRVQWIPPNSEGDRPGVRPTHTGRRTHMEPTYSASIDKHLVGRRGRPIRCKTDSHWQASTRQASPPNAETLHKPPSAKQLDQHAIILRVSTHLRPGRKQQENHVTQKRVATVVGRAIARFQKA